MSSNNEQIEEHEKGIPQWGVLVCTRRSKDKCTDGQEKRTLVMELLLALLDILGEPLQTFKQTFAGRRATDNTSLG